MNQIRLALSALAAFTVFAGLPVRGADNMASIAITPATGVVTLTPRWAIGGNLAGFHHMSQDLGLTGSVANNFYSIKSTTIPAGGDILAFNFYVAGSGSATPHADIGSKLTPDFYSALSSADPDVGFGAVNLYFIHHKGTTDYFSAIIPGSATSSAVTDLKPMSGPGGPGTVTGVNGYFGLTFAASNLGYGLNNFYYLRTDPVTGLTKFGTLAPALLAGSADQFDLVGSGHNALAFTGSDVGYGVDKMYYLRLDPVTGFTIFGMLDPALAGLRHTSDIANLGSVYTTLTFVPGDVGFGSFRFYATGTINATWQSVSFAAITDRAIAAGSFTVNPTASSALPIVLTVVAGSTGSATISSPVGGVFTITPTQPGIVTLQASQAGAVNPIPYEANMLRQSFTVTGIGAAPIITSVTTAAGTVGTPFNFSIVASGSPTSYTASPLPAGVLFNTTTGAFSGTPTTAGVTSVAISATNLGGTDNGTLTVTIGAAGVAPIISNVTIAAGTVGSIFNFSIVASGSPTSYTASPLPPGVLFNGTTGVFSGTPSAAGVTLVALGATNGSGTGNATLTITVAAAGIGPIITSVITAPGTVGTVFGPYQIVATGSPTSYSATGLPAGLIVNTVTGAITGTPTTAGVSIATLIARNSVGTGAATLTITVAAVGVAPILTSATTTSGAVGTVFVTYQIVATGSPTGYSATGLPAGLTVNALTGAINGTPTTAGVSVASIKATNSAGTGTASLTITVAPASALPIFTSANTASGTVGTAFITYQLMATGNPTSFNANGLPEGLVVNTLTGRITGTPVATGNYHVFVSATTSIGIGSDTLIISIAPAIRVKPVSTTVASGAAATFTVAATSGGNSITYQWQKDGVNVAGATNATLTVANVQPANVGFYQVVVTSWGTSVTSTPVQLGITFTGQIAGTATLAGTNVQHANGNFYDWVLLTGPAASVKAVAGRMVRVSFIDLTNDIVQVEFSGAGVLTVNLESSTGPAAPVSYNQPGVLYMKGHATISIAGADATTDVSVFSLGRSNGADQTLFPTGVTYDGYADIALLSIASADTRFGGVRTANANYFRSNGTTGLYAPGAQLGGPMYVGDINGANSASAVLVLGSVADARITGGDLLQSNGGGVEVSGMTRLQFTAGASSGGALLPAQTNRGILITNGANVTSQVVSP